ncbi:MAG: L,D-transpeptidase family protein [Flavobacteriales bacterium]
MTKSWCYLIFVIFICSCESNPDDSLINIEKTPVNYLSEIDSLKPSDLNFTIKHFEEIKLILRDIYSNNSSVWENSKTITDSLIVLWQDLPLQAYPENFINTDFLSITNTYTKGRKEVLYAFVFLHLSVSLCPSSDSLEKEHLKSISRKLQEARNWIQVKSLQTSLCFNNNFIRSIRNNYSKSLVYTNPNLEGAIFNSPKDSTSNYEVARYYLHQLYSNGSIKSSDSIFFSYIKQFQSDHGLEPDGKIGTYTRKAMSLSGKQRLQSVNYTLNQMMKDSISDSILILVNIPSYQLFLVNNQDIDTFRVIVGTVKAQTVTFDSKMQNILLRPEWNVPYSISSGELLPKLKKDATYAKSKNYKVYKSGELIDAEEIDWSRYTDKNFPYRIVKDAGPANDLGLVKFNFLNPHSIYIHDTPSKTLFNRDVRSFSHGCIRVQDPFILAEKILHIDGGHGKQPADSLYKQAFNGVRKIFTIKANIPVYIRYYPVLGKKESGLVFYPDIYNKVELKN